MINQKELREFLVKAKKATYASGDNAKSIVEADKSTSLFFEDGELKYHDNYFGGEPFGGREVVFLADKPVYIMVYYGRVSENVPEINVVYKFLQKALSLISDDYPYRGPKEYSEDNLVYTNQYDGDIDNFSGEEVITMDGKEVFRTKYIGGVVNRE